MKTKLLIAIGLFLLGLSVSTTLLAQPTYFYFDSAVISPPNPTPGQEICLTVSGTKSTPCVYEEYFEVYPLGGNDLALDMCFNDTSTCIQILWPWDTTYCIPGLPAGDYVLQLGGCNHTGIGQTVEFTVSGMAGPQSQFAPDPEQGCAPLEVSFLNESENADMYLWDFDDGTTSTEESPSHLFTVPGSYTITLTVTNSDSGQSDVESFTLVVFPNPEVELGSDTTITTSQNLTLYAGSGFASYLWQDGSTNAFLQIDGSQLSPGMYTYSVTVTNAQGCEGTDEVLVTITEPSGLFEAGTPLSFRVFPNPAVDFLRLETTAPIQYIQWLDLAGRVMWEEEYDASTLMIRLPNMPNGIYLLKAITGPFAYGVLVEVNR